MKNQIHICCPRIQDLSEVSGHLKKSEEDADIRIFYKSKTDASEQVRF